MSISPQGACMYLCVCVCVSSYIYAIECACAREPPLLDRALAFLLLAAAVLSKRKAFSHHEPTGIINGPGTERTQKAHAGEKPEDWADKQQVIFATPAHTKSWPVRGFTEEDHGC